VTRIAFHTATVPYKTLSPDNDTVQAGRYVATTLRAVDSDLDAANIADSIEIFGITGTFVGGALAEDILGTNDYGDADSESTSAYKPVTVAGTTLVDLVSLVQAYDASSMAVGVGFVNAEGDWPNSHKIRLYMGGVEVAESGFVASGGGNCSMIIVIGTRALSGSQTCKISDYNYIGTENNLNIAGQGRTAGTNKPVAAGIGVGSIKR